MPSTKIDYSSAKIILNSSGETGNDIVSTPYGLSILEIQGELNLPQNAPASNEKHKPDYLENFVKVDQIYDAVKFGKLHFDDKDMSKATLYIGKSQRLLGTLVDLDTPLAVLRIPKKMHNEGENETTSGESEEASKKTLKSEDIKIIDIVKKKIIFKQRPLPIM